LIFCCIFGRLSHPREGVMGIQKVQTKSLFSKKEWAFLFLVTRYYVQEPRAREMILMGEYSGAIKS
jgi:hypothetical protein